MKTRACRTDSRMRNKQYKCKCIEHFYSANAELCAYCDRKHKSVSSVQVDVWLRARGRVYAYLNKAF